MGQRRHHYEAAFEHYLRTLHVPYVMVDEAKKALLPPGAQFRLDPTPESLGQGTPRTVGLKSFDFVIYGSPRNYLVEIKGRRLSTRVRPRASGEERARPASPGRLESWVTLDDLDSLERWEALFGEPFRAAFVFIYLCDELPSQALFEEMFDFRGKWYALRAVELSRYKPAMKERSARWRTVHLPSAVFDRISAPLCGAFKGLPPQSGLMPNGLHAP
jgi:hypothetical protein